ncbi:MAG: hypothetical protein KA204_04835 [Chromatiaceae bacterium]|nr:hypothetical protein [Chromatiaceae bacterium]MBP6734761.1 hypothetical protein [Chromatiaceae bacterium]MBP6807961.1 hypothetical protein [Chromatiaceae bacterium]MBP8282986.1 hypothetical protein [Chromatiaceae bacterium]MBP8289155.1 hypothetical protein [Chromatiaceae bacterium]
MRNPVSADWGGAIGAGAAGWLLMAALLLGGGVQGAETRYYDDTDRQDDSGLRWNVAVIQSLPEGSQSIGLRGAASYQGDDGYRQD